MCGSDDVDIRTLYRPVAGSCRMACIVLKTDN